MFALVFCFELRARAARTCCHCHLAVKNPIHDGNQGQLKLPKSHERYHNVVMWHWIVYKWRRSKQRLSFHRTFFNLLVFTVSLSCKDRHSETPWSHSSNQPGGSTVRHWISCCAPTIGNVMRECKIGKSSPHQPCENTCHSNVLELSSLLWMARALACF